MSKQGFNFQFYCRECKRTKNGTAPLEISININGERKFINLPMKLRPEEFNRKRQPKEVVDYMAAMRTRINEILAEMARHGEPVTTRGLIDYLKNGGYKAYSVENLFDEWMAMQEQRMQAGSITKFTYWKYGLVRNLFYTIVEPSQDCEKAITHAAVMKFKIACDAKYEIETAAGYMRRLKTIITFAIDNGHLRQNPFSGIKIKRGEKPIIYLSKEEQRRLIETPIDNKSLARIRDAAVIQMCTGLSYGDLQALRPEDIKEEGGVHYIEKPRRKTGKTFTAVILPEGMDAIKRWNYELISNQKYNAYLKVLGDICMINTPMTTHLFRRTYSTNLLNSGIRLEVVAAAIGDNIQTVKRHYAQLQRGSILAEIGRVI